MASPPAEPPEKHEWSAYYDEENNLYYYNHRTQESAWDAPDEGFNPPPPREEEQAAADAAEAVAEPAAGTWQAFQDESGQEYYYNAETGETQWERPDDFVEQAREEEEPVAAAEAQEEQPEAVPMEVEKQEQIPQAAPVEKEEKEEEKVEPEEEIAPLTKAQNALNEPDAIMEPGCIDHLRTMIDEEKGLGRQKGAEESIQALVGSCVSQPATCGLLGKWLLDFLNQDEKKEESSVAAADEVRTVVQETVNRVAKERFTLEQGDRMLHQDANDAKAIVDKMVVSPQWRKLLIDLYATNKGSALLKVCLSQISKMGYHRDIGKRTNYSDHFTVYNAMLASELAIVGGLASNEDSSSDLNEIVEELRRTCTTTSHTYVYAVEVLRALREKAKAATDAEEGHRLDNAIRKWERLSEELESVMVDPSSSAAADQSTLFRKRRLGIALTSSELRQRQRRRHLPPATESDDKDERQGDLESALLEFLRRNSLGLPLDERVLDKLLPEEGDQDNSNSVGKLLIAHPLSLQALLGHLFKPGSSRVSSMVTRNKCARLTALSVLAAERTVAGDSQDDSFEFDESDVEKHTGMLLTGSQLCELLENMMTFEVTNDPGSAGEDASAGRKLCVLALKSAPVAQGVMIWAAEVVNGPEYVTSAAYATLSPSIILLLRIIADKHPFTRLVIRDVALAFLKHSNSEISYQKMKDIKERCVRLLLFLLVKGEITSILGSMTKRLDQQGASEIDTSLVRYFVGGLLDILQPPYSLFLLGELGQMLLAPKCKDALGSSYFSDANKKRLSDLVDSFEESLNGNGQHMASKHLVKTVAELRSLYSNK